MWQSQLCRLPSAFQEMPSQPCQWNVEDMSCSSSTINWYLRPRRNMNCQGISLVMTSERAKSWVATICYLSWSSSVFFDWVTPLCTTNSERALGVAEEVQRTGLHYIAQKGDNGESQVLRARKQEVTQETSTKQELMLSQKEFTKPRLTSNQILQYNPLPLSSMSLPRRASTIRPPTFQSLKVVDLYHSIIDGRLKYFQEVWNRLLQDKYIQQTIQDLIPLLATPVQRPCQPPVMNKEMSSILNERLNHSHLSRWIQCNSVIRYYQLNIWDLCVSSLHYSEKERRAPVDSEPKSIESVYPKATF